VVLHTTGGDADAAYHIGIRLQQYVKQEKNLFCDYINIVRLAKLLDDLVVARIADDLVERGYNPATLHHTLRRLVEYGFVNLVEYNGVKYYHLTGLGAELLKVLKKAVVHKVVRMLEGSGVRCRVWWGDSETRAVRPVIHVDGVVNLPPDVRGLVELEVVRSIDG